MDNQEQARTHTQGHEGHGVHVCYKCGWLFPNPHPSAKQRRAHKKICGTIEGCKLLVSETQNRLNASDDEHHFDDDCNTQADSVPNSLGTGENEKHRGGTGENLTRSGDEVFLDAIANFSDGALSPGVRYPLRDSLQSATDVERVDIKYPEFSRFSWDNDFNASGASENVVDFSLTSEIKSDTDMIEIMVSSENSLGETCKGVPKLAVSDVVNSDFPVAGGAFSLNEKNNAEFLSVIPQTKLLLEVNSTESTSSSTNGVQVESADTFQFATSNDVKTSQETGKENVNVFTYSAWDDELDKARPKNKYDVKDHEGILLQNFISLHSSEGLKQKQDGLSDSVAGKNSFLINQRQLSQRREVLLDVDVLDSSMKKQNNIEPVDEEIKEINNVAVDGKCGGANVAIGIKTKQPSNLQLEVKPSSGVYKCDEAFEMSKTEKCDKDEYANSKFECPIPSEVVMDRTISMRKGVECTGRDPLSNAQQDIKGNEVNSDSRGNEECNRFVGSSVDAYQVQDRELIVKPAQRISVVEDAQDGGHVKKVFGCTAVPVFKDKLASSAIHTSVDPDSCFDSFSFKGDSDSLSVSGFLSTDVPTSTEAAEFGSKDSKNASQRQRCENPELFEPPSFMTLVEPGLVVSSKVAASEAHKETETNEQTSSSQAGWFPTITHVASESQGRKRNQEKIAEITNWSPSKQQTPLRTLLGEASHKKKPKSPKLEQKPVHQKNSGSGLTTGNSILGRESPATQAVKGKNGKEWDSPTRHAAGTKRQSKKVKGRPYWVQFVCCSSADVQRS